MSGTEAKAAAPAQRGGETSDKKEKSMTIRQQNMAAVKGKHQILCSLSLFEQSLIF